MHPITRIRHPSNLLAAAARQRGPQTSRHTLPTSSHQLRPYSHGGYGDGTGDPRAENPQDQGEVDPATEKIEHPGTQPTKPRKPDAGQQQQEPISEGEPRKTPKRGSPTMRDDSNDVSNEATNFPPEQQTDEVRRHNEDVVKRHEGDVGRDKAGGRE